MQNLNIIVLTYIRIIDQCPGLVHILQYRGRRSSYRMVVGFTTTYTVSAYYHRSYECEPRSGVLDTTLCDRVCQLLATGQRFSPVSSTNKTDHHDITEILLKVALNTTNQPKHTLQYKMAELCYTTNMKYRPTLFVMRYSQFSFHIVHCA